MAQSLTESPWLDVMRERLGTAEVGGKKANPAIMAMFADVGHPEVDDDSTAWCAAATGSALKACSLPIPPNNVSLLARSYCTYGVKTKPRPGAIAIWPRGNSSWQGHVNIVESVTDDGKVICIGGNQTLKGSGGAITRTKPLDPATALDFRWPVMPTVPDLRKAGSTEIKKGDRVQNLGLFATFIAPIIAAIKELLAPITAVPQFADINEGLTFWQTVLGGANAVARLVLENPWLAGTVFVGLGMAWVGHTIKAARVAKAEAGVPLSAQVAAMGSA